MKHFDLALLAQSAYTRAPLWQAESNDRARAMLDMVDGVPVVSVPGTDPTVPADLITDGDCDAVWVPGLGFCHDGFQTIGIELWPLIKAELFDGKKAPRVVFTGHSLGGAVAMMLAALALRDGCAGSVELITFGCPRVGAQRLAARLWSAKKTLYRFGDDPVPRVPWFLWQWPPVLLMHPTPLTKIGTPGFPLIEGNHSIGHYVAELQRLGL